MNSTRIIEQIRLPIFLFILLLFLIAYPYFHQQFPEQIALVELFFALLMIAGISLFVHQKILLIFTAVLAVMILIGILISGYTQSHLMLGLTIFIELIFFFVIFISMLIYVFSQQVVTHRNVHEITWTYHAQRRHIFSRCSIRKALT